MSITVTDKVSPGGSLVLLRRKLQQYSPSDYEQGTLSVRTVLNYEEVSLRFTGADFAAQVVPYSDSSYASDDFPQVVHLNFNKDIDPSSVSASNFTLTINGTAYALTILETNRRSIRAQYTFASPSAGSYLFNVEGLVQSVAGEVMKPTSWVWRSTTGAITNNSGIQTIGYDYNSIHIERLPVSRYETQKAVLDRFVRGRPVKVLDSYHVSKSRSGPNTGFLYVLYTYLNNFNVKSISPGDGAVLSIVDPKLNITFTKAVSQKSADDFADRVFLTRAATPEQFDVVSTVTWNNNNTSVEVTIPGVYNEDGLHYLKVNFENLVSKDGEIWKGEDSFYSTWYMNQAGSGGGGSSDHGALSGLGDDDHTQYLLEDGSRALSGDLDLGSKSIVNVNLVDGVDISALKTTVQAHTDSIGIASGNTVINSGDIVDIKNAGILTFDDNTAALPGSIILTDSDHVVQRKESNLLYLDISPQGVQGTIKLTGLCDVNITNTGEPSIGDILVWSGSSWEHAHPTAGGGGGGGSPVAGTNIGVTGSTVHVEIDSPLDMHGFDIDNPGFVDGVDIQALAVLVSTNEANILHLSGDVLDNTALIASNTNDISHNADDINNLSGVTNTNANNIASNSDDIAHNADSITDLSGVTTTNANNILSNADDISHNADSITDLTGEVNTANTERAHLSGDLVSHPYVVIGSAVAQLENERILGVNGTINLNDAGAGNSVTLSVSPNFLEPQMSLTGIGDVGDNIANGRILVWSGSSWEPSEINVNVTLDQAYGAGNIININDEDPIRLNGGEVATTGKFITLDYKGNEVWTLKPDILDAPAYAYTVNTIESTTISSSSNTNIGGTLTVTGDTQLNALLNLNTNRIHNVVNISNSGAPPAGSLLSFQNSNTNIGLHVGDVWMGNSSIGGAWTMGYYSTSYNNLAGYSFGATSAGITILNHLTGQSTSMWEQGGAIVGGTNIAAFSSAEMAVLVKGHIYHDLVVDREAKADSMECETHMVVGSTLDVTGAITGGSTYNGTYPELGLPTTWSEWQFIQSAIGAGSTQLYWNGSTDTTNGVPIPPGKILNIMRAYGACRAGATAGTYTATAGVTTRTYAGGSPSSVNAFLTGGSTTANGFLVFYNESSDPNAPLQTITGGANTTMAYFFAPGGSNPGALANYKHRMYMEGFWSDA